MQDDTQRLDNLTPAHRELEDALRGLTPAAIGISRDRLMFQAGAAAGRRSVGRWRGAAVLLMLGNAVLLTAALRTGLQQGGGQIAQVPSMPAKVRKAQHVADDVAPTWEAHPIVAKPLPMLTADAGYVSVRDAMLRGGLLRFPRRRRKGRRGERRQSNNFSTRRRRFDTPLRHGIRSGCRFVSCCFPENNCE